MRGLITIFLAVTLAAIAQEPTLPTAKTESPDFFSGAVMSVTSAQVTVHRRGLGTNAATKKFFIDSETKVEGRLKVKANVTVQYSTAEDGSCRAIHIIVR